MEHQADPSFVDGTDTYTFLIDRYCAGQASPEDLTVLAAWFREHPGYQERVEKIRSALVQQEMQPFTPDQIDGVKAAILGRTHARSGAPVEHSHPVASFATSAHVARKNSSGFWLSRSVWYPIAGLVLGGVLIAVGARDRLFRPVRHKAVSMATYTTGNGQRATIALTDGSTVVLGVASRLEVPADYPTGNRTLRLAGEALFTVRHGARTPFTVVTGTVVTRVLGTSFMVRQYPTDTATVVVVRDGKVAVRSAVLTAAQQAEVGRSGAVHVGKADLSQLSFADGVLTLNAVRLSDAIPQLNRWYDADIRLGDPRLAGWRVTGECAAGALSDLVNILELTLNVRVVRDGRVLTLFPR